MTTNLSELTMKAFADEIRLRGLEPPAILLPDAKIHRFPITNGNGRQSLAGWYIFFGDSIPSGAFGNWKTGEKYKWSEKSQTEMTEAERISFRDSMAKLKVEREKIESARQKTASQIAQKIWDTSTVLGNHAAHAYLKTKRVQSHGLRVAKNGCLVVPVMGESGVLQSLQFIGADGTKKFLSGGQTRGGFFRIDGDQKRIAIVEGYATGASVHNATGFSVFVAFNCHNLEPVAKIAQGLHPSSLLVVCADNDQWTDGNPGLTYGRKAAESIQAKITFPLFKDTSTKPTDFNDLAILHGLKAVGQQIFLALTPAVKTLSGAEILKMVFREPLWLIPGLICIGLCLLGGKPKSGKSIMVLNLIIAVVTGGVFFGHKFEKPQNVILLGLEDTARRLQDRIQKMTIGNDVDLSRLLVCTEFKRADQGGLSDLEDMIKLHRPALVVIDTLKKFKPAANSNRQLYDTDYESLDGVKRLSDKYSLTILIVHHLRKMAGDDPFDCFSGSLGLTGVADSLMVLQRRQTGMVLAITGREQEDQEYAVKMDAELLTWNLLGDASEVQNSKQQQAIFDVLKESETPLGATAIHKLTGIKYDVVRQLLRKMLSGGKIDQNEKGYFVKSHSHHSHHSQHSQHSHHSQNTPKGENCEWVKTIHSQFSDNDINSLDKCVSGVNGVYGFCDREVKI